MKNLTYDEAGPDVLGMNAIISLRKMCIDEHRWPGCEDDPDFTSEGQGVPVQCQPADAQLGFL